ncbi:LacI family DNA-binding transcriptional regulator [Acidisoma sp.]|uniref:LacI family DNA-binding transcriptional regulator n=1 Tax=Acidisoma sp. TaxID=1872115 RepID=UPI003B00844E
MERQKSRLGLEDVARRAGVGLSTVDRVLNERGSVSAATERRVIEAARSLGLRRVLPVPHARQVRIEVMLAQSVTPFMARLTQAMGQVAATLDRSIVILRTGIDMRDPANVASRIAGSGADGIIVYCEEHPANVAAIAAAEGAGRPVICVVTDVPDSPRAAYVGIDHTKAGRTAAFFVARMARPAGVALTISTSTGFRAHKQRIDGFREALATRRPGVAVAPVMTSGDEPDRVYHLLTQALRRTPEAVAIYNTGGANAAVAHAVRDAGRAENLLFVGHELTDESAALLRAGAMTVAIDQAPELQARRSIDLMLSRLGITPAEAMEGEIAFTLHTVENC